MRSLTAPLSDHFGHHDAVRLAEILKALAHPNRLLLLNLLRAGEQPAGALFEAVEGIGQSTVSNHLKVLLDAGLVEWRIVRKTEMSTIPWSFYRLAPGALADVAEVLGQGDRR